MPRTGPTPFECAVCGKSFRRRPDLGRHALIHNPEAERFHCSFPGCNHSSLQKSNLKTHYIAKHLGVRLYNCRFDGCTKNYNDASALIRHEKLTHGFYRKAHKPYERTSFAPSPSASLSENIKLDPDYLAFPKIEPIDSTLPQFFGHPNSSVLPPTSAIAAQQSHERPSVASSSSLTMNVKAKAKPNSFVIPKENIIDLTLSPPLSHSSVAAPSPASSTFPATPSELASLAPAPSPSSNDWYAWKPRAQGVNDLLFEGVPPFLSNPSPFGQGTGLHTGPFDVNTRIPFRQTLPSVPSVDTTAMNYADFIPSGFSYSF